MSEGEQTTLETGRGGGYEAVREAVKEAKAEHVARGGSTEDPMRKEYRPLSGVEVAQLQNLKDIGATFHGFLDSLGSSREISLAKTRIEEAVMWGTKHVTR